MMIDPTNGEIVDMPPPMDDKCRVKESTNPDSSGRVGCPRPADVWLEIGPYYEARPGGSGQIEVIAPVCRYHKDIIEADQSKWRMQVGLGDERKNPYLIVIYRNEE